MEWQPIETAPKDKPVLIWVDGTTCIGINTEDDEGPYWNEVRLDDGAWGGEIYPTHWMPLPTPPRAECA
jgi:hypothetical protein